MTSRLQRIEIRNFKAFRDFSLDVGGKHLLVFGPNGSGKSSLFWAIHSFLQSGHRLTEDVAKYFDPNDTQNLLNFHEQELPNARPGEISLVIRESASNADTAYKISQAEHGTYLQPTIVKGDLASDFITYRFFFGFSHFRNSENFDIWPLFEKEILPYCVNTEFAAGEFASRWKSLRIEDHNPNRYRGPAGSKALKDFNLKLSAYSRSLATVVEEIRLAAQAFYDAHFALDDLLPISIELSLVKDAERLKSEIESAPPIIRFGIRKNGVEIHRPQSHLNEAKMTQMALSIRFAASIVNLHESDRVRFHFADRHNS